MTVGLLAELELLGGLLVDHELELERARLGRSLARRGPWRAPPSASASPPRGWARGGGPPEGPPAAGGAGGPPPGGGAVEPPPLGALIVTVFVAVAVWPSSSFARTATVWLPGASKRRERLAEAPVCTTAPSTLKRYSSIEPPSGSSAVATKWSVAPLGRAGVVDGQRDRRRRDHGQRDRGRARLQLAVARAVGERVVAVVAVVRRVADLAARDRAERAVRRPVDDRRASAASSSPSLQLELDLGRLAGRGGLRHRIAGRRRVRRRDHGDRDRGGRRGGGAVGRAVGERVAGRSSGRPACR